MVSELNGDAIPEPSFINSTVTIVKFDSGFSGTSRGFQADVSPICDSKYKQSVLVSGLTLHYSTNHARENSGTVGILFVRDGGGVVIIIDN